MKTTILLSVMMLTGCVSLGDRIQQIGEAQGAPQELIDAVKHGCASGRAAGGSYDQFMKDYEQYKNNVEYKMRWDDAFALCKGKFEDDMRMIR